MCASPSPKELRSGHLSLCSPPPQSTNTQPVLPGRSVSALSFRDSWLPPSLPLRSKTQVLSHQSSNWRRQPPLFPTERTLQPLPFELPNHTLNPYLEMHLLRTLSLPMPDSPEHQEQILEAYHCRRASPMSSWISRFCPSNPLQQPEDLIINTHAWHLVGI